MLGHVPINIPYSMLPMLQALCVLLWLNSITPASVWEENKSDNTSSHANINKTRDTSGGRVRHFSQNTFSLSVVFLCFPSFGVTKTPGIDMRGTMDAN